MAEAARADDTDDPDMAADLLYLITRGAMITSMEDPARWPTERLARAATYLVDRLRNRPDNTTRDGA
jgi:hypothetical protein